MIKGQKTYICDQCGRKYGVMPKGNPKWHQFRCASDMQPLRYFKG